MLFLATLFGLVGCAVLVLIWQYLHHVLDDDPTLREQIARRWWR